MTYFPGRVRPGYHLRACKVDENGTSGSKNKSGEAKLPIVHTETTFGEDQKDVREDNACKR